MRAPQVIAWVALGFALDQPLARQLADLASTDVSFLYHEQGGRSGIVSTLDAAAAGQLEARVPAGTRVFTPALIDFGGQPYLTLSSPLRVQAGTLQLVVQRSQPAAMARFWRCATRC